MWLAVVFMMIAAIFAGIYYNDPSDSVGEVGNYEGAMLSSPSVIQAQRMLFLHQQALVYVEKNPASIPGTGVTALSIQTFASTTDFPSFYNFEEDEENYWTILVTSNSEIVTYTTREAGLDTSEIATAVRLASYESVVSGVATSGFLSGVGFEGSGKTWSSAKIALPANVPDGAAVIYTKVRAQ